ncbi:hypothetical protein BU23DRAFT_656129 [Bimuria novae-zelandiae CBS 107.79]|uniref:Uncharacterized protein n=1 Tax=Bimuria novae-zelandiae CBS 107.79 TaxID=1447943 RepID=A0A6A5V4R5_9PLEO|nr:hypothetical protein BU23DRAFT_656129 [Bimuria novae-zelandiae CBS 107.79]
MFNTITLVQLRGGIRVRRFKMHPQKFVNSCEKMRSNGYFNVIEMRGDTQRTYCVGKAGMNKPNEIAAKAVADGGRCLLTNGNYFVLPPLEGEMEWTANGPTINDVSQYKHYSIGFTSNGEKQVGIPPDCEGYYEKFEGTDGSFMWCCPVLKDELDFESEKFCKRVPKTEKHLVKTPGTIPFVNKVFGSIPGSLSHASSTNERLVTVIITPSQKYVFSYTSKRDADGGIHFNQMRELIDIFLTDFASVKGGIKSAHLALNVDGGGSVYVNWINARGEQQIIAAGKMAGKLEFGDRKRPRPVQMMVKHSVMKRWIGRWL